MLKLLMILAPICALTSPDVPGRVESLPAQNAYICDCSPDETHPGGESYYLGQQELIQWNPSEMEEELIITCTAAVLRDVIWRKIKVTFD